MATSHDELIRNAVVFLQDPKTQASPITQRVQFLEAKGLTPAEIETALRLASTSPVSSQPYSFNGQYASFQPWDWRDYFITGVVSGALTYGAITLFKKYLWPHLQPPTSTAYEDDRDALTAQFDAAEVLLKEIQAETLAVKMAVEEQKEKVEKATQDVEDAVVEMRQNELKTRDEVNEIREEVKNIRDMLPRMIDKTKESQTQSLTELQQELKSLKALLLNRSTSTPSPSLPVIGKPSIPAWQLASTDDTKPSPSILSFTDHPKLPDNGKGKETEIIT